MPCQTELGGKRIAIAFVIGDGDTVHFGGTGDGLVAKAGADGKVGPKLPDIAHEILLLPLAESSIAVAETDAVAAGNAQAKIGDRIAPDVVAETKIAAI